MALATTKMAKAVKELTKYWDGQDLNLDRRIRRSVEAAINQAGYPFFKHISVIADGGRVILRGKVPSYYAKQLAQTAAMQCEGVTSIQNDLMVT